MSEICEYMLWKYDLSCDESIYEKRELYLCVCYSEIYFSFHYLIEAKAIEWNLDEVL